MQNDLCFSPCLLAFLVLITLTLIAESASAANTWGLCPEYSDIPVPPPFASAPAADDIHITADHADLQQGGISQAVGDIQMLRGNQQIRADKLVFDQQNNKASFSGDIYYWGHDLYLHGDSAYLELDNETGTFKNTRYMIKHHRGQGQADTLLTQKRTKTLMRNADYSTCGKNDNFWKISAKEVNLDHAKDQGNAKNIILRIKDLPVFYSPYLSFPLSEKRKTGFLAPDFTDSSRGGVIISTPFYWNIAPHKDATLIPRLMSKRGLLLAGEFRHLAKQGYTEISGEYLPNDTEFNGESRHLLSLNHTRHFAGKGNFTLDYNRVSDQAYFEDFASSSAISSQRFLEQRADLNYRGNWWDTNIRLQGFQSVDRSVTEQPYKRLPQILFHARSGSGSGRLNYQLSSEYVYFYRRAYPNLSSAIGSRIDLLPSVSYPQHTLATFVVPRFSLRYTQYDVRDSGSSNPSRLLPIFSLDSGLFLQRALSIARKSFIQTLEPRLFYLYVPEDNQDDIPIFDTSAYDFSFDSLFRENRFTGADRVGDANQIVLALGTRFINRTSNKEIGYLRLGQAYYLKNHQVFLPEDNRVKNNTSPIIAEVTATPTRDWKFRGNWYWDPSNSQTIKLLAQLQYKPAKNKVINLSYRSRNTENTRQFTTLEQSNIAFHWPIKQNWHLTGRWNHALKENRLLEIFGGIKYDSCCWGLQAGIRRFLTGIDSDFSTGVFFQIELKGLLGVGNKKAEFLQYAIPGQDSAL